MMRKLIPMMSLVLTMPGHTQDSRPAPIVIDAQSIMRLESKDSIDFLASAESVGKIKTGWFRMSSGGNSYASVNDQNEIIRWYIDGTLTDVYGIRRTPVIDVELVGEGILAVSVHQGENGYYVNYAISAFLYDTIQILSRNTPLAIWSHDNRVWLEIMPNDPHSPPSILQLPLLYPDSQFGTFSYATEADFVSTPYAPATDPDAFVRVGRIPPPFAVTSSQDGLVKLWNLETGEVTATAKVDGLPVFGQINASGSHLAWRDPDSKELHLLNFETGEDKLVANLDGEYIQFMFLTLDADVIIGVNVDFEPVVVAWDVATGQRYELGEYRPCSRVPDMARLSKDGTTLVIGCDTGLDIWRVAEGP